jgi:hypothetical protein
MSMLFSEAAAPATPATGKVALYAKTDGRVYSKDDVGTETSFAGITLGTSVTASGTAVDFTGLPSGIKRIIISISGLSTNGTSNPMVQIGDSGGIEATGYLGSTIVAISGGTTTAGFTTGIGLNGGTAATTVLHATCTLTLIDSANHMWIGTVVGSRTTDAAGAIIGSASKSLSATLDRVRITMVNGTDTFDAGTINIQYE